MVERSPHRDLASLMFPSLTREAKQQDADRERRKAQLLKHLREANAAADARLARERRG